jgi:hypothetical protein
MIEFLKINAWLLSGIAIVISFTSLSVTIYDKIRAWKEQERVKKLRREKAILKPILELRREEYFSTEVKQQGNSKHTSYNPYYSRLYHLIQGINSTEIENKSICEKLISIQKLHADNLFTPKKVGQNFSVEFSDELTLFIAEVRKYLSDVI